MLSRIQTLLAELKAATPTTPEAVEALRVGMLGRSGQITKLIDDFRELPPEQKRELGKPLNDLKSFAQGRIKELQEKLQSEQATGAASLDLTRTAIRTPFGTRHPLAKIQREIEDIFYRIGFTVEQGPELEDDWHVFSALNFPPDHPARDMQDTFFISANPDTLLRTHTSSVQVRIMERQKPPIRAICPGRVFRNEDISARAHCQFHQVEGLYVDRGVSFAQLKQTLLYFARETFGADTKIRLRPSFFPFTEPSAEVDVSCNLCGGKGCNVCKHTGWLEILGCGMVDPNVLQACGIDPLEYSGFAFGMGVERIAMLRYGVNDLRLFFENDMRFLQQF